MEKDKDFRSKTKGALIYPIIVIIAMLVVATIMMIFVIPQLTKMYSDFGAKLPLPTQILVATSGFMVGYWWLIGILLAGGIFAYRQWLKTRQGQLTMDKLLLDLPIVGVLRAKIILTEFARTMALLLSSGISLLQALEIVSQASDSLLYREAFEEASKQVEKGIPLSQALAHYTFFPPILPQMIAVGEETGKLDEVLRKLSVYFQAESEQAVKNLTAAIEPLIMVVLGLGVAFLVIAIILPIYNLTSQF